MTRGYSDGIRRLPSGKYQVRVKVEGRIRKQSLPTLQAAQVVRNYLRTRHAAARLGMPPPPAPVPSLTLVEAFDRFITAKRLANRSEKYLEQLENAKKLWTKRADKPTARSAGCVAQPCRTAPVIACCGGRPGG